MKIEAKILQEGERNITLLIIGEILQEDSFEEGQKVFSLKDLKHSCRRLRIDSANWIVQEKMGINFFWGDRFAFVMESRNATRWAHPLEPPKEWNGDFVLSFFGVTSTPYMPKRFTLMLELDKQ